tara:strand:+ start:20915 stop:22300 length:1386 start_codon:yes stop_codon:yes gene_type:complete
MIRPRLSSQYPVKGWEARATTAGELNVINEEMAGLQSTQAANMKANHIESSLAFLERSEDTLQLSADATNQAALGRSFYQLGKLHYDKADLIRAEENFLLSLKCGERPRDIFSMLKVYGFLIRIASERLENTKASLYIKEAEILVEEMTANLASLSAEYFYNVGIVKNYGSKFDEARQNFELAYKRSKEENEPELLAKCLLALAMNATNRQDNAAARDYLTQLNQLLTIITKNYLLGAMYHHLAKVELADENFELALENLDRANRILNEKKCWNLYGYVLLAKGMAHKFSGKYELALEYFGLALDTVDKRVFKRLTDMLQKEVDDVNDSSVDIFLDRVNRKVKERSLGTIDFKHRFVLLEILFLLAKNPGVYYDKEQLAKMIWKDEYNPLIHDKLIYTSVSRLRKLIEPKGDKNDKSDKRKYVIRGKDGYTFNPHVNIRFHNESRGQNIAAIGNVELSSPV